MPIRVPVQKIVLMRDGKRVIPPSGKPFEFTAKEIEEINAINPAAIRKPVQEVVVEPAKAPSVDAGKKGSDGKKADGGKGDDQL